LSHYRQSGLSAICKIEINTTLPEEEAVMKENTAERVFNLTSDMLDPTFADKVAPDREKLLTCIQCGTCTASCPTAYAMDYTPRQLWRLVQLGLKNEVLSSNSFWLCTACYACKIGRAHV